MSDTTDPISVLTTINPERLRRELRELDARRKLLSSLLRAAAARDRERRKGRVRQGVSHAAD